MDKDLIILAIYINIGHQSVSMVAQTMNKVIYMMVLIRMLKFIGFQVMKLK